MPTKKESSDKGAFAIITFVFGMISWFMVIVPAYVVLVMPISYAAGLVNEILSAVSVVFALAGIIFGAVSLNSSKPRLATAGLTLNIVMVAMSLVVSSWTMVSVIAQMN